MMYSEFLELTGGKLNVSFKEYTDYIEPDYMDSDFINKSDYIKQHIKERKNGIYDLKKRHREEINELTNSYNEKMKKLIEQIDFYEIQCKKNMILRNKYKLIENIVLNK